MGSWGLSRVGLVCGLRGSFVAAAVCLVGVQVAMASSWVMTPIPVPPGAQSARLVGVSCTSRNACIAVGQALGRTLAERWNGSRWAIQPTPRPRGSNPSGLASVSCTSPAFCLAVGGTLVESWDGRVWSIQSAALPVVSGEPGLSDVSCAARTACVAVGEYRQNPDDVGTALPLVEWWDGRMWSLQATPAPPDVLWAYLTGVSCASRTACMAVGTEVTNRGRAVTLAERWDGTRWSLEPVPAPIDVTLSSVSCSAPNACAAVASGLLERWDGTRWSMPPAMLPAIPENVGFTGVSCASRNACTAVGTYGIGESSTPLTLAERFDGKRWSVETTSAPFMPYGGELDAVSCPSVTACIAVGDYNKQAERGAAGLVAGQRGPAPPVPPTKPPEFTG